MKKLLLIAIFPFLISFMSISFADNKSSGPKSYPKISGFWPIKPIVKFCKVSGISKSRAYRSISYWQRLGYEFEDIIINDESMSCVLGPRTGEIVITIPDQRYDWSKLGTTLTSRNIDTQFIIHSIIQIPDVNREKERVIEHEIGHALGWNHTSRSYHIMNKSWANGGHDSTGLKYSRYIKLSNDIMDNLN